MKHGKSRRIETSPQLLRNFKAVVGVAQSGIEGYRGGVSYLGVIKYFLCPMSLQNKQELWSKMKSELSRLTSSYEVLKHLRENYLKKNLIDLAQQGKIVIWWHNARIKGVFTKMIEEGNQLVTVEDLVKAQLVDLNDQD